jgi:hypothetical protein
MTTQTALKIDFGHQELVIRRRYEALSIGNDALIALWFLVGSILFFWEDTATAATWCFLLGSIEFLVRPAIRLSRSGQDASAAQEEAGRESAAERIGDALQVTSTSHRPYRRSLGRGRPTRSPVTSPLLCHRRPSECRFAGTIGAAE